MPHFFFFFFWNVPDSWGALGLRAVPLFTPGGWVGGLGVRDVSCSITKGGRCGHKTFQKMLDSIAIRLWMVKSSAEQFLREQWVTSKTPQVHLLLSFPTGHELVNWWCDFIKSTIKTYKSQILCMIHKGLWWWIWMSGYNYLFPLTGGPWAVGKLWPEVLLCRQIQGHRLVSLLVRRVIACSI